jgi:hypothetical protein
MDKYKKINGPINIIRLEGKIFGHNKILYLFLDKHFAVQSQTKCQDYLSDDVVTYLNREFHKIKDKNIDFFVETAQTDKVLESYDVYKDRYIDEVIKFFYKYIKKDNNKNLGTIISNHIRFHYVDIRNYIRKYIYKYILTLEKVNNILNANIHIVKPQFQLKSGIKSIKKLIENIEILIKIIENPNLNVDLHSDKNLLKINYIINKITNKYNHSELTKYMKTLIKMFIDELNYFKSKLITLQDNLNTIIDLILKEKYGDKINSLIKESNKSISSLNMDSVYAFSWLIDIYFIRRVLDKDYIDHAVAYTGGAHSLIYVYFLVKNFDFKITHASKINGNIKIDKINSELKNNKNIKMNYLWDIFLPENDILQCSDLSTFPNNFD